MSLDETVNNGDPGHAALHSSVNVLVNNHQTRIGTLETQIGADPPTNLAAETAARIAADAAALAAANATFGVVEDVTIQAPMGTKLDKLGIVLGLGAVGAYDEELVESPCVFVDPVSGRYAMVFVGYGTDTGAQRASVGLAYSDDLVNWTKHGKIFGHSGTGGAPDENGTTGPLIVYEDGVYYLFYIGLTAAGYEQGTKRLCLATATSLTGAWTRLGAIISPSGAGWRAQAIYHPSIVKRGSTYYMFFNALGTVGTLAERIGYATATSLLGPWTVDDVNSPVLDKGAGWESQFVGDPSVHRVGDLWRMDYFGVGTGGASDGYATTTDALFPLGWTKAAANPILVAGAAGSIDELYAHKPYIFKAGGRLYHFYTAVMAGDTNRRIALAVDRLEQIAQARANRVIDAAGNWSITTTSYTRRSTADSITLTARVGDWIEVSVVGAHSNEAIDAYVDVASIVANAPVNYWYQNGVSATGKGFFVPGGYYGGWGGSVWRQVTATDLDAGASVVLLSLYGRVASAGTKIVFATGGDQIHFAAKNHGQ